MLWQAYNNWCSSYNVSKYVTWNVHENVEITKNLFEMWEKEYDDLNTYRWVVELKETKELMGTIDVVKKQLMEYGTCEIGYCYGEKFWGKGYGTEALTRVIEFLFEECDANLVCSEHLDHNPGSGKVMVKSGLIYEAT